MTRTEYILAVLSASDGAPLSPVQVQKLAFLLDRKLSARTGGPHYNFEPYDYGPFDKDVYADLRTLAAAGDVEIDAAPTHVTRRYRPTPGGLERGRELLGRLDADAAEYVRDLSAWVRGQPFAALVTAVYNEYPEMRVNSVFRG
jgi:uncharacterized protein